MRASHPLSLCWCQKHHKTGVQQTDPAALNMLLVTPNVPLVKTVLVQDTVPAVSRNATFIPGLEVDLASATAAWLSPTSCLLSLKSGKLLAVAIRFEGPVERRLQVSPAHMGKQHTNFRHLCKQPIV